jgi:transcriptional regulator with XRE-family HTH domain
MMKTNMQYSVTESIGDRLRMSRKSRGYSQAKFAATLSVPPRTYMGWEYNNFEPSARGLRALHTIHHIDLHWLLTGSPERAASAPAQSVAADRLRGIFSKVIKIFDQVGAELAPDGILNISLAILQEGPAREDRELRKLKMFIEENRRTRGV